MKPGGVLSAFTALTLAGLCGALALGVALDGSGGVAAPLVSALVFAVGAALAAMGLARSYPHAVLGLCNVVTTLRLMLAAGLVGALVAPAPASWIVFAIAGLAFAMDGLDGALARREGLSSDFGARFDMEVDSLLALTLAILAFTTDAAGAYVLLLGLPRYAFGIAQLALPWLDVPLPERFSRKVVCVVQIFALLMMVFPPAGAPLTDLLAAGASLALVWSFWRDIAWAWQTTRG